MEIKSHELARELLAADDKPLTISVDVSTCDKDSSHRVFTGDYFGINDMEAREIVLLFAGTPNF